MQIDGGRIQCIVQGLKLQDLFPGQMGRNPGSFEVGVTGEGFYFLIRAKKLSFCGCQGI